MNTEIKKSFFSHNEAPNAPTVNRSSAVFYFRENDEITTQVHFMNYWLEKKGISNVTLKLTIRDMSGKACLTVEKFIDNVGGYVINLKDFLSLFVAEKSLKEGSVELEFFSDDNLFFPYPAVVVRYLGDDWHSSTHTCQRNFHLLSGDTDDRIEGTFEAEEGNITIPADDKYETFFIIHNGKNEVKNSDLEVTITSSDGNQKTSNPITIDWQAHETKIFNLSDFVDYKEFFNNEIGTFTVRFSVSGVFSRIVCGQRLAENKDWSIDHSNFAALE